jgi:hypothetical protein
MHGEAVRRASGFVLVAQRLLLCPFLTAPVVQSRTHFFGSCLEGVA